MSLSCRLSFTKIRLLKLKTVLRILIILLGMNTSASAQSLNEYCLSTVGQIEENTKTKVEDPTPQLPPFIDSVENLPELYSQPCNNFYRFFWGECERKTFFSYSPTLNKAFIQGHRRTDWGGDFAHLEISPSGTKSVPEPLVNSGFLEDLPTLNGAVFKSNKGEALFYNGNLVTNLSSHFPEQKKTKNNGRSWNLKKTLEGRIFIVDDGFYSKRRPFVMELKTGINTGINVDFVSVPQKIANQSWDFFTLNKDAKLWVLSEQSILTEIDGKLKQVVIISPPNIINFYINVKQLADGSISFQIENKSTELTKNYFFETSITYCKL